MTMNHAITITIPSGETVRVRRVARDQTVQLGDYMMTMRKEAVAVTEKSIWLGHHVTLDTPWVFWRPVRKPKVDPMIAATKRIRAKTTLGQLEKLLADRAKAQRRVTLSRDRLDLINRNIAKLAQTMAEQRFDSDLEKATTK
jgi:hypothetical protein